MAGNGINPMNSTSMTASGMSLQNHNGLVGQRQIPLNKFSRSGVRGAGLINKNAAAKQRVTSINFYSQHQKKHDTSSSVVIENNATVNSVQSLGNQHSITEPTSKQALNIYN